MNWPTKTLCHRDRILVIFYHSFHIHFCLYLKTNNHPVVWSFPRSSFLFPRQILRGLSLDNSTFSARHKATLRFLRYLASQYNYVTTFLLDKMKSIKYIPLLKTISPAEENMFVKDKKWFRECLLIAFHQLLSLSQFVTNHMVWIAAQKLHNQILRSIFFKLFSSRISFIKEFENLVIKIEPVKYV